jgi:hypothetical protein
MTFHIQKSKKIIPRFLWKHKKTPNRQSNPEQKDQCCFKKIAGFIIPVLNL